MKQMTVVYVTEALSLRGNGISTVAQREPDEDLAGPRLEEVDAIGQLAWGVAALCLRHGMLSCRGHRNPFGAFRAVVEEVLRFAERLQSRCSGRLTPGDVLQPEPVVIE
ncbi:hypothetical protein ACFYQA_20175 [Streptomyces sp. NPDC005774]|uniref:hypothetical protein n=1 Tax=Streptomyces sp. NPDC005774 TaxID=3364728 RepID=UPI0036A62754